MNKQQRRCLLITCMLLVLLLGGWCFLQSGAGNALRMLASRSNSHSYTAATGDSKSYPNPEQEANTVEGDSAAPYPETGEKIFEKYLAVETEEPLRSEKEIKDKYLPRFSLLQEIYEKKLNTMLTSAAQEYRMKSEANEKVSRIELLKRYYKRGRELEADCDMCFERLLGMMEKDIQKAHLSSDLPQKVKEKYEETKKERQKELLRLIEKEMK